jgi:hypothetical protein
LPLHRNKVAAIKMPELGEWLAVFFCTGGERAGQSSAFWGLSQGDCCIVPSTYFCFRSVRDSEKPQIAKDE